jgi:hypothetical protein
LSRADHYIQRQLSDKGQHKTKGNVFLKKWIDSLQRRPRWRQNSTESDGSYSARSLLPHGTFMAFHCRPGFKCLLWQLVPFACQFDEAEARRLDCATNDGIHLLCRLLFDSKEEAHFGCKWSSRRCHLLPRVLYGHSLRRLDVLNHQIPAGSSGRDTRIRSN